VSKLFKNYSLTKIFVSIGFDPILLWMSRAVENNRETCTNILILTHIFIWREYEVRDYYR